MHRYATPLVAVLMASALPARAGLYSPAEPTTPLVSTQGVQPLPFPPFRDEMNDRLNVANPAMNSPLRKRYLDRQANLLARGLDQLTVEELASLGECRIRLRELDAALDVLQRARGRDPRNFWVSANLATLYQQMGQYHEAMDQAQSAQDFFPDNWPGGPAARDWFRKVERAQLKLLRLRVRESGSRPSGRLAPATDVDNLFDVRFEGPYEPGRLPDAERTKLPPEALAVVQQLLLWTPDDTRLYWLLGELYNAQGDLTSAAAIFDECLGSRRFDAPALRTHRQAVREALAAQALPPPPAPTVWVPESRQLWVVGAVAVAVVVGLAYLQLREFRRRRRLRAAGRDLDCPSC